jgi:hypothetical protein
MGHFTCNCPQRQNKPQYNQQANLIDLEEKDYKMEDVQEADTVASI